MAPAVPQGTNITFQEIALFGGSPSSHSFTSSCQGDAQLEVYMQNPSLTPITIQNITIFGSSITNATALVSLSNSCLTLAEASPSVTAGGDYQLEGYVTVPLRYTSLYNVMIKFSNGQVLNQSLIAQS